MTDELKIHKLLGSKNYELWSMRMKAVLIGKDLWDTVADNSHIDDSAATKPQRVRSQKALAAITLALSDGPLIQARNINNAAELWIHLRTLYESRGFSLEFLLF